MAARKVVLLTLAAGLALAGCGGGTTTVTTTSTTAASCPSGVSSLSQGGCSRELPAPQGAREAPAPKALGSSSNGHLTASQLAPITGGVSCADNPLGGQMANNAAAAWNHIAVRVHKRNGYWLQTNGCASSYRNFNQQVILRNYWCGLGACGNAAVPGTSNHGIGTASDSPPATVSAVNPSSFFDQGGGCSDAPWEAWHIHYCGGYTGPDPGPYGSAAPAFNTIQRGDSGPRVAQLTAKFALLYRPTPKHPHYMAWGNRGSPCAKPCAAAIRAFQRDCHLSDDGIFGQKTNACMNKRWRYRQAHHK